MKEFIKFKIEKLSNPVSVLLSHHADLVLKQGYC